MYKVNKESEAKQCTAAIQVRTGAAGRLWNKQWLWVTALINDDTVPLGEDGDQNVIEPDAQDDQEETTAANSHVS